MTNNHYKLQIIGFMASTISAISLLPQIFKTFKEKSAEDLSLGMLLATLGAASLWLTYGIVNGIIPQLISSGSLIISCIILIFMKYYYDLSDAASKPPEDEISLPPYLYLAQEPTTEQIVYYRGMNRPQKRIF